MSDDDEYALAHAEWERARDIALPAVQEALLSDEPADDLLHAALQLYRAYDGNGELHYAADLRPVMEAVVAAALPAATVAGWFATATLGAREYYALPPRIGFTKTWVTRLDDRVRPLHREHHGETIPATDSFDLDGVPTRYPGEPVGPIEHWINCRCHLRRGVGAVAAAGTSSPVAATTDDDDTEPEPDDAEDLRPDGPIQWHSVMTVEGKRSGDRRSFSPNALSWRDLPLPLEWQRVTAAEHGGALLVGRIDGMMRAGDEIRAWGVFADAADADEVIGHIADGTLRGISPTVDDIEEAAYAGDADDPRPMRTLDKGRVCSGTIVNVPAFAEAYLTLGPPPDEWSAMAASAMTDIDEDYEDYRQRDTGQRKALADKGHALPDGSFPIADVDDLRNAIQAIGRAKDPAAAKRHIIKRARALNHPELIPDTWSADGEDFARGPGWVTHPRATRRIHDYWTKGRGAAKIAWGAPHDFYRCRRHLAKYVGPNYVNGVCAQWHHDALGYWPNAGPHKGRHGHNEAEVETMSESCDCDSMVVVASAPTAAVARRATPASWTDNPHLPGPTPIVVEPNGQVYGHLAQWGVCHIGIDGRCVEPPRSRSNYAYFRTGVCDTDAGEVPVGVLTMNTLHADRSFSANATIAHYENTGTIAAAVSAGEDDHGIWVAGTMLPMGEGDFARFRAATLSGDWRWIGGGLELVGALVVNVPGFPVPRLAIAASGGRTNTLVAAGVLAPSDLDIDAAVERVLAAREARSRRRERAAVVASAVRAERLAALTLVDA